MRGLRWLGWELFGGAALSGISFTVALIISGSRSVTTSDLGAQARRRLLVSMLLAHFVAGVAHIQAVAALKLGGGALRFARWY